MNIKSLYLTSLLVSHSFALSAGGLPAVLAAAKSNDLASFKEALPMATTAEINALEEPGRSALWWALSNSNEEMALLLLQRFDIDANLAEPYNKGGLSLLHVAVMCCPTKRVIESLISRRAKVDFKSSDGYTSLHFALMHGNAKVAGALLVGGANPNVTVEGEMTPFHMAIQSGDSELVRAMLKYGAHVDAISLNLAKEEAKRSFTTARVEVLSLLEGTIKNEASSSDSGPSHITGVVFRGDVKGVRVSGVSVDGRAAAGSSGQVAGVVFEAGVTEAKVTDVNVNGIHVEDVEIQGK